MINPLVIVFPVRNPFPHYVETGFIFALLLSPIDLAHSEAFRILGQSASATSQSIAFAAQADDPSAIHYNPAGMTQLEGFQVSMGTNLASASFRFKNATGTKIEGDFGGTVANPPPTNLYVTASLKDLGIEALGDVNVGLGVTTPFGLLVDYPDDSQIAQVTSFAALQPIDIKPTLAYRINPFISVGAGLDIYTFSKLLGEGQAEQKITAGPEWGAFPLNGLGITPGSRIEANGTDTAIGFNFSLLLTPLRNLDGKPRFNLAFIYRSGVSLELEGTFLVDNRRFADAFTELNLPEIYSGGFAYWPIRDNQYEWKIEVDLDYVDWTSFKNLNLTLTNIDTLPSTEITLPFPRDYSSAFVVMLGTEYKMVSPTLLNGWDIALRTGYAYSKTPVPERTFVPAVPDSNAHVLSAGVSFTCSEKETILQIVSCGSFSSKGLVIDLGYQVVLYDTRQIQNNIDPLRRVNGTWDSSIHLGTANIRSLF